MVSKHKNEITKELEFRDPTLPVLPSKGAEKVVLRRVADSVPTAVWFIVLCELCERFTFFGVSGPFQNYIQFPPPQSKNDQSGAIGKGQETATALALFFQFFCYVTPIVGAIVADQYLGKYKTITLFSFIYMIGLLLLILTSIPPAIAAHASLPGLIVSMIIIGFGTGGIKSNVSTMVAEQYTQTTPFVKTLKSGEKVIVDPKLTIQSIFHWFYFAINVGALSPIITTSVEKYHSFWLAYSIPLILFCIAVLILILGKDKYVKVPPQGSVIWDMFRVFLIAFQKERNLDNAKPSNIPSHELAKHHIKWTDEFVDELRSTLQACRVFIFFPIFWIAYNQTHTNLISQAATMKTGFLPNDVMNNIDPIALLILVPLINQGFYPVLRRFGIIFRPVTRMFIGFMFATVSMLYSAILQYQIYQTGPCFEYTRCIVNGRQVPNDISIWLQAPVYVFVALSEVFACVSGLEYAYNKAPVSMKSLVAALYLATYGLGAALGFLVVPLSHDPFTIYVYIISAAVTFLAGCAMLFLFRDYDRESYYLADDSTTGLDG